MTGRKPTPTALRILRGNPGRRPLNKQEPVFADALPEPPAWLPAGAKEEFITIRDRIAAMGYASVSHTEALALLALRLEEVRQCTEAIESGSGLTYRTTAGGEKACPEVLILHEAAKHAQSLLAEFGLTPSSASRVVVPSKQKNNRFDAI